MTDLLGPVPFDYASRSPGAPLERFVETIWYARGTIPYTREKIAPTGSTVAVIILGDPIRQTPDNGDGQTITSDRGFLIGPHDGPTVNEPTGETFALGIVTTPVGCTPVFGIDPGELRGRAVLLEDWWPPAAELGERLRAESDPAAMMDLVEAAVRDGLQPELAGLDRCERAVELLEDDPIRPVSDIAADVGVSHGHLDREFTRVVGLTPRAVARLLRMRRLLERIDIRDTVGWSDLAAELGWYDQAHLIRDFKRHTGVTPTDYLAAQRATYTTEEPGDAAGFVPEP